MLILLLYHTHVLSNMQTDYVEFDKDNHICTCRKCTEKFEQNSVNVASRFAI